MAGHIAATMHPAPQSRQRPSNSQHEIPRTAYTQRHGRGALGIKGALFFSLLCAFTGACTIQCFRQIQGRPIAPLQPWTGESNRFTAAAVLNEHNLGLRDGSAFVNPLRTVLRAAGKGRASCKSPLVRLRDAATSSRLQRELRLPPVLKTLQGSAGSETETTEDAKDAAEVAEQVGVKSELWGNWTEAQVKDATLLWIEQVVIGMKLCPFAMEAMGGLRIAVSEAEDFEMALDKFDVELKWLVGLDKEYACTMIVYPPAMFEQNAEEGKNETTCAVEEEVEDFEDKDCTTPGLCSNFESFMSLAKQQSDMAQCLNAARGQDIESETLLLTFHPQSQFGDVDDDPADFALRSPFPTVLLLRGSDVREAEDVCEQQGRVTEDIAIANEARLRQVGYSELAVALENIWSAAMENRAEELIETAQQERERALEEARLAAQMEAGEWGVYDGVDGIDGLEETRVKPLELQDGNVDYAGLDGRLSYPQANGAQGATVVEVATTEGGGVAAEAAEAEPVGAEAGEEGAGGEGSKEMIAPFDPFGYAVAEENLKAGPLLEEDELLGGDGPKRGDGI